MNQLPLAFWSISASEMLQRLEITREGLISVEAKKRLARYGTNLLKPQKRTDVLTLLLAQFKSPPTQDHFRLVGLSSRLFPHH